MINIIVVHDLMTANGKTIKENNMELKHNIPLKALVEINSENLESYAGVRLYVCEHNRDCDGTPLYSLYHSNDFTALEESNYGRLKMINGFSEDNLTVIKLPGD